MSINLATSKFIGNDDTDLIKNFKQQGRYRLLADNVLALLLQYIGLMFSVLTPHPIPFCFATGTACAFLFLRGFRILPGLSVGSFIAFYFSGSGLSLAILFSILFSAYVFTLAYLSIYYISQTLLFYNLKTFIKFLLFTSLVTGLFSFLLTAASYPSLHYDLSFSQLWLQWDLAMQNSIFVFSCALITWDAYFPEIARLKQVNKFSLGIGYGLLSLLLLALSCSTEPSYTLCLTAATLPLTLFLSYRFGWCGAVAALFIIGLFLSFAASLPAPLFSTSFSKITITFLQLVVTIDIAAGLFLAIARKRFT